MCATLLDIDVIANLEAAVLVPRRFLVIISPMSGYHKSEMIFKQCVQPMLDLADIQYIVEVTSECI